MASSRCFFEHDVKPSSNLPGNARREFWVPRCLETLMAVDISCIRVLQVKRSVEAGFGHQITEFLFSLRFAELLRMTPQFESFQPLFSNHGDNYEAMNKILGLEQLNQNTNTIDMGSLREVSLSNITAEDCGVVVRADYATCRLKNCFHSPTMSGNFHRASRCLRELATGSGDWLVRNPFDDSRSFTVVWHIRLGDVLLHRVGDKFYQNIYSGLEEFLDDFNKVEHVFVGAWNMISQDERKDYETFISRIVPNSIFADLSTEATFLYMMHADLLIGSGSSMPSVAALFSNKVVYINSEPTKPGHTGWGFLGEYFPDGLTADSSGNLLHHVSEIRARFSSERLGVKLKLSARKKYFDDSFQVFK